MTWTPSKVVTMCRMWDDGDSAAEIGRAIGMTRNAVLGKAHRLRLGTHKAKVKERGGRPRKPARMVLAKISAPLPKPQAVQTPARPCKLFELERDSCRWPHGDPCSKDFYYCGAVSMAEQPYCLSHYRLAYRAPGVP